MEAPVQPIAHKVNWNLVRSTYRALLAESDPLPEGVERDIDVILKGQAGDLEGSRNYTARLGTTLTLSPHGHAFVNGKHFKLDDVRCDADNSSRMLQLLSFMIGIFAQSSSGIRAATATPPGTGNISPIHVSHHPWISDDPSFLFILALSGQIG